MFEMPNMAQTFVDILSGRRNNLKNSKLIHPSLAILFHCGAAV